MQFLTNDTLVKLDEYRLLTYGNQSGFISGLVKWMKEGVLRTLEDYKIQEINEAMEIIDKKIAIIHFKRLYKNLKNENPNQIWMRKSLRKFLLRENLHLTEETRSLFDVYRENNFIFYELYEVRD